MKNLKELFVACLTITGIATLAACTVESPTYVTAQEARGDGGSSTETTTSTPTGGGGGGSGSGGGSTSDGGAASGSTCSQSDYITVDVSKLTACGNGTGHCYDPAKVDLGSTYAACPGGTNVCVPDEVLTAGGKTLKSCSSIIGPGGCITASDIPAVLQMGGSALKQDVCTANQLCVPCKDPTHNNAPTGMCSAIGAHQNACGGGTSAADGGAAATPLQTCCKSKSATNGVCISGTAIPASQRDQTKQDTCNAGDKCVPAAFVSNMPVKCDGGLFGQGVCMDQCFNDMMGTAKSIGILSGNGCGSTEVCVPCGLVSGQGVPGCQ